MGLANLGQSDTKNVYATGGGYAPLHGLSALSTTGLSSSAMGAIAAQDATGTTNSFAGDSAIQAKRRRFQRCFESGRVHDT